LKDKLSILKLIKECEEGKFALFKDGPSILNVKSLEEREYIRLKLDKLIKDSKLVEGLDKLDPDNASGSKNDGINYWKGKKIVTLAESKKKIATSDKAFQKGIEDQRIKEALQYFPDDYEKSLFGFVIPQELMEATKKWEIQYLELMQFRNNSKYGRSLCFNCLLCPDKEERVNVVRISRLIDL
jgi:hypothetical protein